jgi:hypothetical protein
MDKDKFMQSINNHLEDIREQFEIIKEYEGKIPAIELDLIMSNIRKVYEAFLKLEKLNQPVTPSHSEVSTPVKSEEPGEEVPEQNEEIETSVDIEPEEEPVSQIEPQKAKPPVLADNDPWATQKTEEPAPVFVPEVGSSKPEEVTVQATSPASAQPAESVAGPVEAEPLPDPQKTTLDLFGEQASTLADNLKDKPEKRVADKLQSEKINDIKSVIGINEKFLFINELFDGSLKNYEDAIDKINLCQSGEEAGQVLDELHTQFTWEKENTTAQSFVELVNRKF